MDNIGQVLRQTCAESLPEFTRLVFASMGGGLIGAYLADKYANRRDSAAGLMAEKLAMIPLIDGYLIGAKKCESCVLGVILIESRQKLFALAMRYRVRLRPKKQSRFDMVWNAFYNTTRAEIDNQPSISAEETKNRMHKLVSRLEAVRKFIIAS